LHGDANLAEFEQAIFPHLNAAYNLARWLTRNNHDAEDVVQEACLRAYQFFGGFRPGNGRTWLLTIVRNTCYTWLRQNRSREPTSTFDEGRHQVPAAALSPVNHAQRNEERELLRQALDELPPDYREVIVLRELEGLSYKEIASIAGIPLGTVMSRLARARERLQHCLASRMNEEP
jgi:RNA polymerase sigma-70 factor (ECF subfamily)